MVNEGLIQPAEAGRSGPYFWIGTGLGGRPWASRNPRLISPSDAGEIVRQTGVAVTWLEQEVPDDVATRETA